MAELSDSLIADLLEAAPDAAVVSDAHGRIVLVNAETERLFGYSRRELLGRHVDLVLPEGLRYFLNPSDAPFGTVVESPGQRRDNERFPAEISLSTLDVDGQVLVTAVVRDASDRLDLEAEREQQRADTERERAVNRAQRSQRMESLGQLAGGVAHDFNNLLAVILNYTSFVNEEVAKAATDDEERWRVVNSDLEQIRKAADRATSLTHQLLAFGRREVGRPQLTDLNDVVRDIEQLLRRTISEDIEFITDLGPDLWPVLLDRSQIDQVFLNLAMNAKAAMPFGGTLSIDTANVSVDEDYALQLHGARTGPHVRVRFSDTGVGMSAATAARAFEPFFTTKPKGEGTGLGLATVYGIVTQADGDIEIYSDPGIGTTFRLSFPASLSSSQKGAERVASRAADRRTADRPSSGGETILVVEDQEALREVTSRMLGRNGFKVLSAANGHEAITLAKRHPDVIHLLLTDVIMPSMSGKELLVSLRQLLPYINVLFMSGYAQPVFTSSGTLDADSSLLEKPFLESMLIGKVREALAQRS